MCPDVNHKEIKMNDNLISVNEAKRIIGYSESYFRNLLKKYPHLSIKVIGRRYVKKDELLKYIQDRTV